MNLPRKLQPGDEVHYVSLLDADGNALATLAMDNVLYVDVPMTGAESIKVDVRLHIHYVMGSTAS